MLGSLKQTHQQRRVFFEVKSSKHSVRLLEELRKNLMIYGYTLESKYAKIVVYLNYYRNRPAIRTIRLESRPGHRRILSHRSIPKRLNRQGTAGGFVFTQTSRTPKVLSGSNADFKKRSNQYRQLFGELLCILW